MNIFHYSLISVFFLLLISGCSKSRNMQLFLCAAAIVLYSSLVAFKGVAGSDTDIYYYVYMTFSSSYFDFSKFGGFNEPGFWLLNHILHLLGLPFSALNVLNAVLIFLSLFTVCRKVGVIPLLVYIPFVGLNIDFSTMRFSFAFHLFIIFYLSNQKAFLSSIVAGMFHGFGFLFFILVLFRTFDLKKTPWYKFLTLAMVLFISLFFMYENFLLRYLGAGTQFLFRDGFGFILQSMLLYGICFIGRIGKRDSLSIILLSFIPVGFRVAGIYILLSSYQPPKLLLNFLLFYLLIAYLFFAKLYSFTKSSLLIDENKSVILHYSGAFL